MDVEIARPSERDLMMRRVAQLLDREKDITAVYRSGGVDVWQGFDGLGYVYHRIKAERDHDTLQHALEEARV